MPILKFLIIHNNYVDQHDAARPHGDAFGLGLDSLGGEPGADDGGDGQAIVFGHSQAP